MIDESNCNSVRSALWDYTAGTLDETEREVLKGHLRDCRECDLHRAEVWSVRAGLKSLPGKHVSSLLSARLHVIASRER
jgi:anti-sigma factor RsiW